MSHCPLEDPGSNLISHSTFQINSLIGMSGCAYETRMHGSLCRHAAPGGAPHPKPREKLDPCPVAASPRLLQAPRARGQALGSTARLRTSRRAELTSAAGTAAVSPRSGTGRFPSSRVGRVKVRPDFGWYYWSRSSIAKNIMPLVNSPGGL